MAGTTTVRSTISAAPRPVRSPASRAAVAPTLRPGAHAVSRMGARPAAQASVLDHAQAFAMIGGSVGMPVGLALGGWSTLRAGLRNVAGKVGMFGRVASVFGIGASVYDGYSRVKAIGRDIRAGAKEQLAVDAVDLVGDGMVAAGSIAALTGAGAALGEMAVGAGILAMAAASVPQVVSQVESIAARIGTN